MYTKFFGLSEKPFSITPDPHFLFLSDRHAEALAHLVYGVTESGGFIQLTGEVGTGKTTLTRCLLDQLPDSVDLAVVLNPRLTVEEFLSTIFDELHINVPQQLVTTKDKVDALNVHLLASHAQGRRTVLLVDEAQNLDSDVLEQLRLLTNLETSKEKLLQIILVGQPELRDTLARNDLRQLAQRITGRYHLENLSANETAAYVKHRLHIAGSSNEIFVPAALWEVHRLTDGVPRLINVICDRALLGAYSVESPKVTRQILKAAASEVQGKAFKPRKNTSSNWKKAALWSLAFILLGGAAWGIATQINTQQDTAAAVGPTPPASTVSKTPTQTLPAVESNAYQLALSRSLNLSASAKPETPAESLASLLNDPNINTSTDQAFTQLFKLWRVPENFGQQAACAWAQQQQLKCQFLVGSTRLMRAINRPAILSLVDDSGQLHNAVVTHIDDAAVTIKFNDKAHKIPQADLAKYWYGEFLVLWRPVDGVDGLLLPKTRSDGVAWLRASLASINKQPRPIPNSSYYDQKLQQNVLAFQREQQLEADGIAGVQTLIAINSALGIPNTPYLNPPMYGN